MQIIGVDHVQFAVRDVAAGARCLAQYGYEPSFHESRFNAEPRSFFRGIEKSMAYLTRGISRIEVITGAEHRGGVHYVPVFAWHDSTRACDPTELSTVWHDELSSICARGAGEHPVLDAVIVRTSELERSSAFWQSLGFQEVAVDDRCHARAFPRNMVSMPLALFLTRAGDDALHEAKADDLGCSSIALITRDLSADRAALAEERYSVSEATRFFINRRPVTVCFASGPSGELVELVEFERA